MRLVLQLAFLARKLGAASSTYGPASLFLISP